MVTPGRNSKPAEGLTSGEEGTKTLRQFPPYGSMNRHSSGDSCPTCRGTGRIPRGQEDQLVAVIPCNDVRLKPKPRPLMVYFSPNKVQMEVTNLMNITNNNFASVTVVDLTIQSLVSDIVVGKTRISNLTTLHARAQKSYTFTIDLPITDDGLNFYCKSSTIKIHTLFLELHSATFTEGLRKGAVHLCTGRGRGVASPGGRDVTLGFRWRALEPLRSSSVLLEEKEERTSPVYKSAMDVFIACG
ncbi:Transmembrane protein 106B [Larimichthys crocea]|uniref:Transmembrane protein 106B n=1 Tax=Larimichthys crocea TaxID=215358 RepID=A0A6G0HY80_LARCR|nr:Transmembrane protein 106B [Larimichthys crocea]